MLGGIQTRFLVFGFILVAFFSLLGVSFFSGYLFAKRGGEVTREVTSQSIVDKINSEAFVVTKTAFLNQNTEIEVNNGSEWSNFLWGQTVDAEGVVRIDMGVDFDKIQDGDISIDHQKKEISIKLPEPEILDASIYGDIEVKSNNGILKKLFDNDPNADHNLAKEELIGNAVESLSADEELKKEAKEESVKVIDLILRDLGYEIVVE